MIGGLLSGSWSQDTAAISLPKTCTAQGVIDCMCMSITNLSPTARLGCFLKGSEKGLAVFELDFTAEERFANFSIPANLPIPHGRGSVTVLAARAKTAPSGRGSVTVLAGPRREPSFWSLNRP